MSGWLDGSIDEVNDDDFHNSIKKSRQTINNVNAFTDVDECIDFITDMKERKKAFMIISEEFSEMIIPIDQDIPEVRSIYIFSEHNTQYTKWIKDWPNLPQHPQEG